MANWNHINQINITYRMIFQETCMSKVTTDLIQKLRKQTGVGMMECKKALVETDGDIEGAIVLLRKRGAKVAEKRSGMDTKQGRIHAYIHPGANLGVLLEIACETDFSANTSDMEKFAHDICMQIAATNPLYVDRESVDHDLLEKEREISREQLKNEGKPEQIIEKIVENKIVKYYETICLLDQKYIKNDKITIQGYLNELIAKIGESIKIKRFSRFRIGE